MGGLLASTQWLSREGYVGWQDSVLGKLCKEPEGMGRKFVDDTDEFLGSCAALW